MAALAPHVQGHLRPGMRVSELRDLGSGCTSGMWVCPRLLKLRNRYERS